MWANKQSGHMRSSTKHIPYTEKPFFACILKSFYCKEICYIYTFKGAIYECLWSQTGIDYILLAH